MTGSDVIVVGSGASAVHAAVALVDAGLRVTMLDVGHEDLTYEQMIPPASFEEIRRTDATQHRYFLGDRLEGVSIGSVGSGPQITPPRSYVLQDSDRLAPKRGKHFDALESFACGGLGRAWGAVAFPFNDVELARCGLPLTALRDHYEAVARRIGISGRRDDDLQSLRGPLAALQDPLQLDHNAMAILNRYGTLREGSRRQGFHLGQSFLAVLSRGLGEREPNAYRDMDFWSNRGRSVYRPDITLGELRRHAGFAYRPGFLVTRFEETTDGSVTVSGRRLGEGTDERLSARSLVLAAGSLGTTRIILRSLGLYDHAVPFVCNPHTYLACLNYRGLGTAHAERCHSLAQLSAFYDPTRNGEHLVQAQMYSYRSLQLFRLLTGAPLPLREGLRIMSLLAPHLVIWAVQHEDAPSADKYCVLRRDGGLEGDTLEINYALSSEERARHEQDEKAIARFVRRLGCMPLNRVRAPHGASVHYAGQFPMTTQDTPLTTEPSGKLRGTRAVYVADGAAFAYLPAKGPTFTLMANAHRIGVGIGQSLRA